MLQYLRESVRDKEGRERNDLVVARLCDVVVRLEKCKLEKVEVGDEEIRLVLSAVEELGRTRARKE